MMKRISHVLHESFVLDYIDTYLKLLSGGLENGIINIEL